MNTKKLTTLLAAACFTALSVTSAFAATTYEHIRNATGKLTYNDTTFLIDPFFAAKAAYPGFEGTFNNQQRMPLVDLPTSIDSILDGVDAVVVTHTHLDHWDSKAAESINKNLPIYVQHEADQKLIQSQGFTDVRVLNGSATFNGVTLSKTGGAHGTDAMYQVAPVADLLADAMGVVFQQQGEKTTYLVGDTIWTQDVTKALHTYNPDVLIMNTGYAKIIGFEDAIIMGTEDVGRATRRMPNAKIVTVHMDTVNHTAVSREDMKKYVHGEGIEKQVVIPEDGEKVTL